MHFTYRTSRVCSQVIDFDLENGRLYNIVFTGGCNGNLKAIAKLLEGAEASFAIERLRGNRCGPRDTSCADQLAQALEKALAEV
ncbi:MAG: TIGR03905 family TSCPD domain-containing protein [Clostridia bacterium]|nr:TIGR03905 family TSCPD domain-containing protein [Clostridia bacterium]